MQIWVAVLLSLTACTELDLDPPTSPPKPPPFPTYPRCDAEDRIILDEIHASSHSSKGAYITVNDTVNPVEDEGHISLYLFPTELDKCKPECGVLQRINSKGKLMTPQIYVNSRYQLVVTVYGFGTGKVLTFNKKIMLYTWQKVVVSMLDDEVRICVSSLFGSHCHRYVDSLFEFHANGPWILGGTPHRKGMPGFMKELALIPADTHLSNVMNEMEAVNVRLKHFRPALTLPVGEMLYLCKAHEVGKVPMLHKLSDSSIECPNVGYKPHTTCGKEMGEQVEELVLKRISLEASLIENLVSRFLNCSTRHSAAWVKTALKSKQMSVLPDLGRELLENSNDACLAVTINILASCYGSPDILFQLAAYFKTGILLPSNPLLARELTLVAASQGSVLANLALTSNTTQCSQLYAYHGKVAEEFLAEWRRANSEDLIAERARLHHGDLPQQEGETDQVFQFLLMQANQGNPEAQANVGRMYYWGQGGVERNMEEAFQMQQAAAVQEHPDAMFDTGIMLMKGQGTEQNVTKARMYLEKAAKKGNKGAYGTLGYIELNERSNVSGAVHYFNLSHELGDTDSTHNLAIIQSYYEPFNPDPYYAHKMFKLASDRGHKDSTMVSAEQLIQGLHNQTGNCTEAVRYLQRLSDQSNTVTRHLREAALEFQGGRYNSAFLRYLVLAEAEVEIAQYNLAWICEEFGSQIKYCKTDTPLKYYSRSAGLDHGPSQAYYANHLWSKKQFHASARWYARAAENSVPEGYFGLGYFALEGIPVGIVTVNGSAHYLGPDTNTSLTKELWHRCFEMGEDEAIIGCGVPLVLLAITTVSPVSLMIIIIPYLTSLFLLSYLVTRATS